MGDAAGKVTDDGTNTFTYSDRGRLQTATIAGGTVNYLYTEHGLRVAKTGLTTVVPGSVGYFGYDEQGQLQGESDAAGAPTDETIYLGAMPVGFADPSGLQAIPLRPTFRPPSLPYRVDQHDREGEPWCQLERQFQDDPFVPIFGLRRDVPWCRGECCSSNTRIAPPTNGFRQVNGCYIVCVQGPFASSPNGQSPILEETISWPPGTGGWIKWVSRRLLAAKD